MLHVTIYNEFCHELLEESVGAIYPEGIHMALKKGLECDDIAVRTVTLDTVQELTDELLNDTDVLLWWGHMRHDEVPDEIAERVHLAVLKGMGAIFLHSGHNSKPFRLLMGTPCSLSWREDTDREYVWVVNPAHPIAQGIDRYIHLEHEETYSEPFMVPEPDELVFIGNYEGGEVFRSGCCYNRGYGKVFYFQPGHERFPTFYHPDVLRVIKNAIYWAKPACRAEKLGCPNIKKIQEL